MKKVGILGGLGPETTAEFYLSIISQCQRLDRSHRPNLLINNVPIPYALEEAALLHGKDVEKYLPLLIDSAKFLEQAGVDFLVMPCNTLHRFADDIKAAVNIPFLSVVDVVAQFLATYQIKDIGLIATGITLESGFYQNKLKDNHITCHMPTSFHQAKLAKMIFGLVSGQYANHEREELIDVIDAFDKEGVTTVLLACTDLQALIPHHPRIKITDTMQLLADQVVRIICEKDPLPDK